MPSAQTAIEKTQALNGPSELRICEAFAAFKVELNDYPFGEGTSEIILASVLRDCKLGLEART
jgi:hypothetical protein